MSTHEVIATSPPCELGGASSENTPATPTPADPPALTKRQIYYRAHRDEEEFMKRNREYRKAYYYRNKEKERTQALERYYVKKMLSEASLS